MHGVLGGGHVRIHALLIQEYRRNWLSVSAYNIQQQENIRLINSIRLTKNKQGRWGVHKERAEGIKAYNGGQEVIRELNSRHFSSPAYL